MSKETKPRKRAKHTRSRLGCGVCRIRHVRCDLAQPACQRCVSTGRTCDGYAHSQQPHADAVHRQQVTVAAPIWRCNKIALLQCLPTTFATTSEDARVLQYFQQNTAYELSGNFDDDDFWSSLVLQVGQREDCVRHMVFALSSLHESISHDILEIRNAARDRAVAQYGYALRSLNHHILTKQGASLDVTLLCCILCITFEWLRPNYTGADVHLRSGLELLQQWVKDSTEKPSQARTSYWSPSGHLIRSTLSPFYTRLLSQAMTVRDYDLTLPTFVPRTKTTVKEFESLKEARDSMYELLSEAYALKARRKDGKGNYISEPRRIQWARKAYAQWSRRLDEFFKKDPSAKDTTTGLVLQTWRDTVGIMVSVKNTGDESIFDKFTPLFANIVDRVEQIQAKRIPTFSADISTIAILYYVGTKCRHPVIRRKAVALLGESHRREGIWDSKGAASVLKQVLTLEESMAKCSINDETDLSKSARLRGFCIDLDGETDQWGIQYKYLTSSDELVSSLENMILESSGDDESS